MVDLRRPLPQPSPSTRAGSTAAVPRPLALASSSTSTDDGSGWPVTAAACATGLPLVAEQQTHSGPAADALSPHLRCCRCYLRRRRTARRYAGGGEARARRDCRRRRGSRVSRLSQPSPARRRTTPTVGGRAGGARSGAYPDLRENRWPSVPDVPFSFGLPTGVLGDGDSGRRSPAPREIRQRLGLVVDERDLWRDVQRRRPAVQRPLEGRHGVGEALTAGRLGREDDVLAAADRLDSVSQSAVRASRPGPSAGRRSVPRSTDGSGATKSCRPRAGYADEKYRCCCSQSAVLSVSGRLAEWRCRVALRCGRQGRDCRRERSQRHGVVTVAGVGALVCLDGEAGTASLVTGLLPSPVSPAITTASAERRGRRRAGVPRRRCRRRPGP